MTNGCAPGARNTSRARSSTRPNACATSGSMWPSWGRAMTRNTSGSSSIGPGIISSVRSDIVMPSLLARSGRRRRQRLALLDDVGRQDLGGRGARVLRHVHRPRGHEEEVAGLQRQRRLALHLDRDLAFQNIGELFARMGVLGRGGAGGKLAAHLNRFV